MDGVVRLQDWLDEPEKRRSEAQHDALVDAPGPRSAVAKAVVLNSQAGVPRRRYIFRSAEWTRTTANRISCKVTLVSASGEHTGVADGTDAPGARAEIAARATLQAVGLAEGDDVSVALKGARVLRFMDSPIVVVGVYGVTSGEMIPLLGACLVRPSVEHASVLATLQAVDRWLGWRARRAGVREGRR